MSADLTITPVKTIQERKAFIRMTTDIYRNDTSFIQPLDFEILGRLNPTSNPLLANNDHQLWIVRRGEKIVGRIGAIINQAYLSHHQEKSAHFGYFEAIDDAAVIELLFKTAEDWARAKGMNNIAGPYNLSINEECGLLVDGFDRSPMVSMPHGRPYYAGHLDRLSYQKATDMYALWYPARYGFMSEKRMKFVNKLVNKDHIEIRNFNFGNFAQDMVTAIDVFNDAWANNWGFVPWSHDEARHLAKEVRPIISKYQTVMCFVDGQPAAFGIVLPNVNEVARDMNGKLLPFNWAKFLWRLKVSKPKTNRMPLMGIRQKFQGKPLGAAFAYKIIEMVNNSSVENGITHAELSWILESNKPMISMLEDIGGVIDKTYRIYTKALSAIPD